MKPISHLISLTSPSPYKFLEHTSHHLSPHQLQILHKLKPILKLVKGFSAFCYYLSTDYQYVNCFLYKIVIKVTGSLGFSSKDK